MVLGAAFWASLGVLFFAWKDAQSSLPALFPTPAVSRELTPAPAGSVPVAIASPAATPTPTLQASPSPIPTATPAPSPSPAADDVGRAPWILLPEPGPGTRVPAGKITVEARARGDAPIAEIRLEVDGAPVRTSLEQRSDTTWRGLAGVSVTPGSHTVRATAVDVRGRSGAFRWTFDVGPP